MEKAFIGHIIRVGSSHGVVIPVEILRGVGLQRGDTIIFTQFEPGAFRLSLIPPEQIIEWKKYNSFLPTK